MSESKGKSTPEELAAKITRLILKGAVDDNLTELAEVIWDRRKFLASRQAFEMVMNVEIGDVVRINQDVRPRYIAGKTCTVVGLSPKRRNGIPLVLCEFAAGPMGKFRSGRILLSGSSFTLVRKAEVIRHIEGEDGEPSVTLVR